MSGIDVSNTGIGVGIAICTCAKRSVIPEWWSFPMICEQKKNEKKNIYNACKQTAIICND